MRYSILTVLLFAMLCASAQKRENPVIKPYGGIFDIEDADLKADPELEYKIVIDLVTGNDEMTELNWSLNNVARMLNLHAVAGADMNKMNVVVAVHGSATYALLNDKLYKQKYGVDNPNTELLEKLSEAGVRLYVCGQSLISREVKNNQINKHVKVATSMLTTVTTHQLNGYAVLKF